MKRMNRALSLVLVIALAMSMLTTTAYAKTFTDIKGHWAESYIYSAVDKGYASGYDDNTFKPGRAITRAEFCKMLNNALGLTATTTISFSDVTTAKWYYKEVQKAVAAGYISGYDDGTFLGDNQITRQEAAVVIARIIADPASYKDISALKDAASIASWALPGAQAVFTKGYMAGDNLGKFNPRGNLTRAEAVKIIETLLDGETIVPGNITISESGQSYSNRIFTGSVIVSSAIGDGSVTFKNCKILGTLLVNGGGTSGIRLSNTTVANLTLNSAYNTGIAAVGTSTVNNAYLSTGSTLVESALSGLGAGFKNVTVGGSGLTTADVSLSGAFDSVTMNAWSYLTLQSGSIAKLHVGSGATGSEISLPAGTNVKEANIQAACDFFGAGTITKASVNASNVTFETRPANLTGTQQPDVDEEEAEALEMTVIPKQGTKNVPADTDVMLTFDEVIRNKTGGGLTVSYVKENVVLRVGSESGEKVDYAPSISQSGMILTLSPVDDLEEGKSYYLTVGKGAFTGATTGSGNAALHTVFHTEGAAVDTTPVQVTANPKGGSEIDPDTGLTFTFNGAMYTPDGKDLTAAYLKSTAFSIRRGSRSGTKVAFEASISSNKKTITLTPTADLTAGYTYYVQIAADTLMNGDWEMAPAQTFTYTVPEEEPVQPDTPIEEGFLAPIETYPAQKGTGVSTSPRIMMIFDEALYQPNGSAVTAAYLQNTALELRRSSATGTKVAIAAGWGKTMNMVTVTPSDTLGEGYTYYLILKEGTVMNEDGDLNDKYVLTFTTGEDYDLAIDVEPGKTTADLTLTYDVTDFDPFDIYLTIRYREEGVSSWTILERDHELSKVKNTLTFEIKGLTAETAYEVEATLDLDETSLSAEATFETTDQAASDEAIAIEKIRFYSDDGNSYYLYAEDFEEVDDEEYYAVLPSKQALLADENDEIRVRVYTYDEDADIYIEGEYDLGDTVGSGESYYIEVDPSDLTSYLTIEVEDSWGDTTYYEIKIYLD